MQIKLKNKFSDELQIFPTDKSKIDIVSFIKVYRKEFVVKIHIFDRARPA